MVTSSCTRLHTHHNVSTVDTLSKLKTPRSVGVAGLANAMRGSTVSRSAESVCVWRRHCHGPHHSEGTGVPTRTETHAYTMISAVFLPASTRAWKELMIGCNTRTVASHIRFVDVVAARPRILHVVPRPSPI